MATSFFWSDVCCGTASFAAGIQPNKWYHVVLVFNNSTFEATLFINGKALPYASAVNAYNASPGSMTLGGRGGITNFLSGNLDDVRIYNRAITAAEVQQLYNAGR